LEAQQYGFVEPCLVDPVVSTLAIDCGAVAEGSCDVRWLVLFASFLFCVLAVSSAAASRVPGFSGTKSAAVSGECSETTALQLVEQHHLNDFDMAAPVKQVLCGPFTGAGNNAMAVTIAAPTCWGIQRWAVFRLAGGEWQLVHNQVEFVFPPLVAVGGDIQVTTPVFRPTDPRCIPSGGKRSRVWHWDGSRFKAGSWKQVEPGTTETIAFYSPSKNLFCIIGDSKNLHGANCWSFNPKHYVRMNASGGLRICTGRRCFNDCGCREEAPILAYGKQLTVGRFQCTSLRTGINCTVVRSGKGFLISRSGVRRVGS
jgi:uncharacterized protein DUF6636